MAARHERPTAMWAGGPAPPRRGHLPWRGWITRRQGRPAATMASVELSLAAGPIAFLLLAEALYVRAGMLEDPATDRSVEAAIVADPALNERQRRVLLDIYDSFRRENER